MTREHATIVSKLHELTNDPNKEVGFNRAKAVYDRYIAFCNENAELFQGRVLHYLHQFQPAKTLQKEANEVKRNAKLIGANARVAGVAKNIADFVEQEVHGKAPTVRPTKEVLRHKRPTAYLHTAFAAGGRDPSDDEGEDYRRGECGEGTNYPAGKRQRTSEKQPRIPTVDLSDLLTDEEAEHLPVPDPPTPPRTVKAVPVAAAAAAADDNLVVVAGEPVSDSESDIEV